MVSSLSGTLVNLFQGVRISSPACRPTLQKAAGLLDGDTLTLVCHKAGKCQSVCVRIWTEAALCDSRQRGGGTSSVPGNIDKSVVQFLLLWAQLIHLVCHSRAAENSYRQNVAIQE